jgi:hypothetical protein
MSTSIVEYEGFLTSGAATLAPALHYNAANFSLGAQASWTVFESGNQILQATAATAWLTQLRERWRLELSGALGLSRYAREPGSAHFLTRSRLHYTAANAGAWLGAATGASSVNESPATPVELSLGAWSIHNRVALVGTVTATWLGSDHHLDVLGAARWTAGRLELEARLGARPWASSRGRIGDARAGVSAELSALVPLARRIALAVSAGSYPSDPVRNVLAANYVTAGLRLTFAGAGDTRPPLIAETILASRSGTTAAKAAADGSAQPRLEVVASGDTRTLRVHAPGATSVEVMGDFTDWEPVALNKIDAALFEVTAPLSAGVHRLNVRIDGGEWMVPAGARIEQDEFGSVVGLIVVR